jgi:dynein heavy chain
VLVEGNLAAPNVETVEANLAKSLVLCIKQLEELSVLVRGELLPLDRKILTALITIDVHARDIVDDMVR